MTRAGVGLALSLVGCAAMAGGALGGSAAGEPASLRISGFRFLPEAVTVSVGDTVVWTNEDALPHTTAADSGAWSSPEMKRGDRFAFVPGRAGRFPYHCAAHPVMRGVLVVRP